MSTNHIGSSTNSRRELATPLLSHVQGYILEQWQAGAGCCSFAEETIFGGCPAASCSLVFKSVGLLLFRLHFEHLRTKGYKCGLAGLADPFFLEQPGSSTIFCSLVSHSPDPCVPLASGQDCDVPLTLWFWVAMAGGPRAATGVFSPKNMICLLILYRPQVCAFGLVSARKKT